MTNISTPSYIGNGAYCFANSMSMLLKSHGYAINASTLEVLSGVGLGAFLHSDRNFLIFSNYSGLPDNGISRALNLLGFVFDQKFTDSIDNYPIPELLKDISKGGCILGPLDMGYLVYNPYHRECLGSDHYVYVYDYDDNGIFLHDPAGYPCVYITFEQLKPAWAAENIGYRSSYFKWWTLVSRSYVPSEDELYDKALSSFRCLYEDNSSFVADKPVMTGSTAIKYFADLVKRGVGVGEDSPFLTQVQIDSLIYFSLPLGARRALDFAEFFSYKDQKLADIKIKQAKLFGRAHVAAVSQNSEELSDCLNQLADKEDEFYQILK